MRGARELIPAGDCSDEYENCLEELEITELTLDEQYLGEACWKLEFERY